MTKFQTAYSLNLQRSITAQEADLAYSARAITSRNAFHCDMPDCNAPMVCVNLETPRNLRRRELHFATSGRLESHSPKCPHWLKAQPVRYEQNIKLNHDAEKSPATRLRIRAPLKRNNSRTNEAALPSTGQNRVGNSEGTRNAGRRRETNTNVHTVRRLVDEFKQGRIDTVVQIESDEIAIRDLFINLSQPQVEIPSGRHVFFGSGRLSEVKAGYLQLRFNQEAKLAKIISHPRKNFTPNINKIREENANLSRTIERLLKTSQSEIKLYALGEIILRDEGSQFAALHIVPHHDSLAYMHIEEQV